MNTTKEGPLKKLVIGAGIFNIIAAFPFCLPFTCKIYFSILNFINSKLNLGGNDLVWPIEGANILLINTCGIVLVLVGTILVYVSKNINEVIGIPVLNAIARLVFAILVVYFLFFENISRIFMIFALIDTTISVLFLYNVYQIKKNKD